MMLNASYMGGDREGVTGISHDEEADNVIMNRGA
jgi:hypothetical protein